MDAAGLVRPGFGKSAAAALIVGYSGFKTSLSGIV